MVDSLKIYEVLKSHLPETQARTVTYAIQQAESDIAQDVKSVFAQCVTKSELRAEIARVEVMIAETKAELIKWMFLFWIGQVAVTLAIVKWAR